MSLKETVSKGLALSEIFAGVNVSDVNGYFVKSFKRGDEIGEVQNGVDCVGVILKGSATVGSAQGKNVSVARPGSEFGICNIFVAEKMPTTLTARVAAEVLFLPKDEFAKMLASDTSLLYRYIRVCNEKMVYLASQLALVSVPTCKGRLAMWIQRNAEDNAVSKKISKDELARQLGISRASLFRTLAELEKDNVISVGSDNIVIIDEAALKACIRSK